MILEYLFKFINIYNLCLNMYSFCISLILLYSMQQQHKIYIMILKIKKA